MGPDSCCCRTRDDTMLLSLILASVAALASSEAGITYTAEPFKAAQKQLTDITYTAEPFKTASKTEIKPISNAAIKPITTYTSSLPQTYMPISSFNTLPVSSSSYPYSLPFSYSTLPVRSNLYTNSHPLTSSNWYYNARPVSNIVPASTRAIPSSISSPVVRALYNPAVVQPLRAVKQMAKREAEAEMTYTVEPFKSKSMTYTAEPFERKSMTYTAEPFKAVTHTAVPSNTKMYTVIAEVTQTVSGYSGVPISYPYAYPVAYNSLINPTSYPTAYAFPSSTYGLPYASSYMYPSTIQPSTYSYNTHPSNFGLCLNNFGAQVPC